MLLSTSPRVFARNPRQIHELRECDPSRGQGEGSEIGSKQNDYNEIVAYRYTVLKFSMFSSCRKEILKAIVISLSSYV